MTQPESASPDYLLWEAGEVRPCRITQALDSCGLNGPQVDVDCGATEPEVDWWEAGVLYPTWAQLRLLAELTDYPVAFFLKDAPIPTIGPVTICSRGRGGGCNVVLPPPRVERFTPDIVRATVGAA